MTDSVPYVSLILRLTLFALRVFYENCDADPHGWFNIRNIIEESDSGV